MSIHVTGDQVKEEIADMATTSFMTKAVYGNFSSLMIATRQAGYHSTPHTHDCEQLNWLQSGELWVFVVDRAFLMKAGDFLRIPAGEIHWAWNKSAAPCTLFEVHTPGLQDDPSISAHAIGLYDEGEAPRVLGTPITEFLPEGSTFDPLVAEKKSD